MTAIPMPIAAGADVLASYPLIAQLFARHGFAELDAGNFDAFVALPGHALLLFTEDPVRYKETLDLAVIVPELARAFPGSLPRRRAAAGGGARAARRATASAAGRRS